MLPMFTRDFEPTSYGLWRPLLRQLDEMFDATQNSNARGQWDQTRSDFAPNVDIEETDDHYLLSFDVPGVRRDDLSIELTGNRLVVAGERKSEGKNAAGRYGKFQRLFTLPDGVSAEGIEAECKDGVLRLAVQKPSAAKTAKIKINDGSGKSAGFLKNLIGDKNQRDSVEVKAAAEKREPAALTN